MDRRSNDTWEDTQIRGETKEIQKQINNHTRLIVYAMHEARYSKFVIEI